MIRPGIRYGGPETISEALAAYRTETEEGRTPLYYAGGTEVATLGRKGKIAFDTLLDLKGIPEVMELGTEEDRLRIGSCLPLNRVIDSGLFPIFSVVASGIADRTVRNRLSVGGNITGRLPYREAVLPLLLAEAAVVLAGPEGTRKEPLMTCFNRRLLLRPGEFILRFEIQKQQLRVTFHAVRRTGHSRIDYPIIHAAGTMVEGSVRLAVSGLCAFPFRSPEVEEALNMEGSIESRVDSAIDALPGRVRDDQRAGHEYRTLLAKQAVMEILNELEGPR